MSDLFNLEGKTCANDDHPAYSLWSYGPGRYSGYRCVHCLRTTYEETLANITKTLAELPTECVPAKSVTDKS